MEPDAEIRLEEAQITELEYNIRELYIELNALKLKRRIRHAESVQNLGAMEYY